MPRVQRGIAAVLALPDPATIAVAPNTHDFVRRLLSALPAGATPRILTSDSEFYSFTRQIARLEEDGLVAVERIAAEPFASFPQRFASAARRGGHDLVYVSQVFFNSAATSGPLDDIAGAVGDNDALVVFDGYHGFMAVPTAPDGQRRSRVLSRRRLQVCDGGRRRLLHALPAGLCHAAARHRMVRRLRRARRQGRRLRRLRC